MEEDVELITFLKPVPSNRIWKNGQTLYKVV